jgi:hypothetical protein
VYRLRLLALGAHRSHADACFVLRAYARAQTWFWRWRPEDKARVRAAQARAATAATAAAAAEAEWAKHARAAKGALGVWSDAGVREARKEFWCALHPLFTTRRWWCERAPSLISVVVCFPCSVRLFSSRRAYEGGKVFAQRHTFYDIFFAVLSGRTEENTFSFVVKCACAALRCAWHRSCTRAPQRTHATRVAAQLGVPCARQLHRRKCAPPHAVSLTSDMRRVLTAACNAPQRSLPPRCSGVRRHLLRLPPARARVGLPALPGTRPLAHSFHRTALSLNLHTLAPLFQTYRQLSGVLFFLVASLAASSVVSAYLGALYGVAGGTIYLTAKAASAQARLQDARNGGGDGRPAHLRYNDGRQHAD